MSKLSTRLSFIVVGAGIGGVHNLAAEFLFLQHQDLYDMLRKLAVDSGAKLRFSARVVDVDTSKASVTLESGEVRKSSPRMDSTATYTRQ